MDRFIGPQPARQGPGGQQITRAEVDQRHSVEHHRDQIEIDIVGMTIRRTVQLGVQHATTPPPGAPPRPTTSDMAVKARDSRSWTSNFTAADVSR
jgi:hypothetical protein